MSNGGLVQFDGFWERDECMQLLQACGRFLKHTLVIEETTNADHKEGAAVETADNLVAESGVASAGAARSANGHDAVAIDAVLDVPVPQPLPVPPPTSVDQIAPSRSGGGGGGGSDGGNGDGGGGSDSKAAAVVVAAGVGVSSADVGGTIVEQERPDVTEIMHQVAAVDIAAVRGNP